LHPIHHLRIRTSSNNNNNISQACPLHHLHRHQPSSYHRATSSSRSPARTPKARHPSSPAATRQPCLHASQLSRPRRPRPSTHPQFAPSSQPRASSALCRRMRK
jgi:hypothetical protein